MTISSAQGTRPDVSGDVDTITIRAATPADMTDVARI